MSRVLVRKNFRGYQALSERAIKQALTRTSVVATTAGRSKNTNYRIQSILAKMKALPPERTSKGWGVFIVSPDFRAVWFEYGTYRRRRRKVKAKTLARRQTPSGQARIARSTNRQGVKPGYFLTTAARVAQKMLLVELKRSMP